MCAALNLFRRPFSERKVRVWLINAGCLAVLEKVLRTSRDKMGDLQIPRVRALRGGTVARSSESGEGYPDRTRFFWFHVRPLAASSSGRGLQ